MIGAFRLAFGRILRRRAISATGILIAAVMAAAIVTLTGDAARRSNSLLQGLRDSRSRSVVMRSSSAAPVSASIATSIASLPGVEVAIGFPPVVAATAEGLHDSAASVGYLEVVVLSGILPLRLTSGRQPVSGEVSVSEGAVRSLRMVVPLATAIRTKAQTLPIVGTYVVDDAGAISDLLNSAALGAPEVVDAYSTVAFLAREPADVATIARAVSLLVPDRTGITLDYERRAAEIEQTVALSGNRNVANLAISVVVVGALMQAASATLHALLQRRENARRRALGFTRGEVITLGLMEATMIAAVGASLGTIGAVIRMRVLGTPIPAAQLSATVSFLAVLAGLASVPGGVIAALQDPARILRVP